MGQQKYKFIVNGKIDNDKTSPTFRQVLGGTDVTEYYLRETLNITLNGNHKNTFSAEFMTPPGLMDIYKEIALVEEYNNRLLYSGIIDVVESVQLTPFEFKFRVSSSGYNYIFNGRTFAGSFNFSIDGKYDGDIVDDLVRNFMTDDALTPEYSEGISIGEIQTGGYAEWYEVLASSASKIFDNLARRNGFVWYLRPYKVFYFLNETELYTNPAYDDLELRNPIEVDEDFANIKRLNDVRGIVVTKSLKAYRNKQFVIGNMEEDNRITASANNQTEIDRMRAINPNLSGVLGATVTNGDIQLQADAVALAVKYVKAFDSEQFQIQFETFNSTFNVQQVFLGKWTKAGLPNKTSFVIDSLVITDNGSYDKYLGDENFTFNYAVSGHSIDIQREVRTTPDWRDRFTDFTNDKIYSNPYSRNGGAITNRGSDDSYNKSKSILYQ